MHRSDSTRERNNNGANKGEPIRIVPAIFPRLDFSAPMLTWEVCWICRPQEIELPPVAGGLSPWTGTPYQDGPVRSVQVHSRQSHPKVLFAGWIGPNSTRPVSHMDPSRLTLKIRKPDSGSQEEAHSPAPSSFSVGNGALRGPWDKWIKWLT